jgi:nucleoside-diphosphate-sugar epimerase
MDAAISPWAGRRVLVTGCTGFLGGAVTRELISRGAKVIGLIRERNRGAEFVHEVEAGQVHLIHGRVEDPARLYSAMAVHEVSAVFHLADAPDGMTAVTQAATLFHSRVPVVTARPASRLRIANAESPSQSLIGIARFGEVFGPRDRNHARIVPRTVLAGLAGESAPAGAGQARDFVYVCDAARACLLLAEAVVKAGHGLDCTFRSGWEFADAAMSGLVADVLSARKLATTAASPDNPHGWRPGITLPEALAETLRWYAQLHSAISAKPSDPLRRAA